MGQLIDPDGATGQPRTSMLLMGSCISKEIWSTCLMWLWSWLTVSSLLTSFHHGPRYPCVATHQVGGQVGFPQDVYRDLWCDRLSVCQAPAAVAPLRSKVTNLCNPQKAWGEYPGSSVRAQTFHSDQVGGWSKEPSVVSPQCQARLQHCQLLQISFSGRKELSLPVIREEVWQLSFPVYCYFVCVCKTYCPCCAWLC